MRTRSFFDIEAEPSRFVALSDALGQIAEQVADLVEEFDEGCGIGARRAADWGLVDGDHFVDLIDAEDRLVFADGELGVVQVIGERRIERISDERGFARSRNPRDSDKDLEWDFHIDLFEVVM